MRAFFASIRVKVLAVLVVPLLALCVVSVEQFIVEMEILARREAMVPLTEIVQHASAALDGLQIERGKTVSLINEGFEGPLVGEVAEQRAVTDARIAAFRAAVVDTGIAESEPELQPILDTLDAQLGLVPDHRAAVDGKAMTAADNVAFYTGVVETAITLIAKVVEHNTSAHLAERLLPFYTLVVAKENAGLERALGAAVLYATANGQFSMASYLGYYRRLVGELTALKEFEDFAIPEQKVRFEETVAGPDVDQVLAWRQVLRALPETLDTQGVDPQAWFAVATRRIELIQQVEDSVAEDAKAVARHELEETYAKVLLLTGINLASLAIAIVAGFLLALRVSTPVKRLANAVASLASGNLKQEVPYEADPGEIGEMARAIGAYKTASQENQRLQTLHQQQEEEATKTRTVAIRKLCDSIESEIFGAVGAVAEEVGRLLSVSSEMKTSAEHVQSNAQTVSTTAADSLRSAETVASATTELSSSISDVAQRTTSTAQISNEASRRSTDTMQIVAGLSDAARNIGNVVKVISEIAEQTNLLALNATIEAARAGDAGKGFAVVAGEVKNLANQTQKSTSEIETQINGIQEIADSAVTSMDAIAEIITRINDAMGDVADSVTQQDQATQEINRSVNESAQGARTVTERIAEVSQTSAGISDLAGNVSTASKGLDGRVSDLRTTLTKIVRTAIPEADRREHERFPLGLPGALEAKGRSLPVEVFDVNAVGVCLLIPDGLNEVLQVGESGSLTIPGQQINTPVTVTKQTDRGVVAAITDQAAIDRLISVGKKTAPKTAPKAAAAAA
mgnify:CR=1 FL=1